MKEVKLLAVFLANPVMVGPRQADSLFAERADTHKFDIALIDNVKVRIRDPQTGAQVFTSLYNVKSWWEERDCTEKAAAGDKEPAPKKATTKKAGGVKL